MSFPRSNNHGVSAMRGTLDETPQIRRTPHEHPDPERNVVNADAQQKADVLIEGEIIKEVRAGIPETPPRKSSTRRACSSCPAASIAHTHLDMPFGGTTSPPTISHRHARRGHRRHYLHRRFRHPGARHANARRTRHLVEEGRGQGLHRLRSAHDRHRPRRGAASRTWTTWCARASPASSSSWPIPTCSWSTTPPSSRPCRRPRRTARSSACTPRTEA